MTMTDPHAEIARILRTPEEMAEINRLLASRYFLVRQGTLGELMICRRCNAKHRYLTLMCVERPWSGLTRSLYGYWRTQPATWNRGQLSPEERRILGSLDGLFGRQPDLVQAHPEMVRALKVDERDYEQGAVALGVLEPISQLKTLQLVDAINTRAHRQVLTMETLDH